MALHPGKCMLIVPMSKLSQLGELQLTINGQKLENVKHEKVLGLHIDNHLNWKEQVNTICKRLNSTIALLKRIDNYLCPGMKTIFYNSYFMSISDYCYFIWGKRKDCSHKISLIQKRATRIILNKPVIRYIICLCVRVIIDQYF